MVWVIVNCFWLYYFGEGIFFMVDDFGWVGEDLIYCVLFDWLVVEFEDGGWSLK